MKGAPVLRTGVVFVGLAVGAIVAMVLGFSGPVAWASTGTVRVLDGCTVGTGAPPSGQACNLRNAQLAKVNLAGVDLAGADLTNADLAGANLTGTNFVGTDMSRANMAGADLTGAIFTGANLTNADLAGAVANDVTIDNVTWSDTICPDFSDSTGDGGSCNTAPTAAPSTPVEPGPVPGSGSLDGSTLSTPYDTGQATNLTGSVVGGGAALAFTGFPTAGVAVLGAALVALGLFLLFLPAPVRRKADRTV